MTRLKSTDCIAKLPVLIEVACHYAMSAELQLDPKKTKLSVKRSIRCLLSIFRQGLHPVRMAFTKGKEGPPLWKHADSFHRKLEKVVRQVPHLV